MLDYTAFCKDANRRLEKSALKGQPSENPLLNYLSAIEDKRKAPKAFGFVHRKKRREINLKSFYLRESYVDAFSESLKMETKLQILNLNRNQLTTNRLIKILLKIPRVLRELNLGNNN